MGSKWEGSHQNRTRTTCCKFCKVLVRWVKSGKGWILVDDNIRQLEPGVESFGGRKRHECFKHKKAKTIEESKQIEMFQTDLEKHLQGIINGT